jgi:hypothetical protein
MPFIFKIPIDGIKFVFFIQEFDAKILIDEAGYLVK